jgi:UDP-2,3-diacylglucosamine hydrolase
LRIAARCSRASRRTGSAKRRRWPAREILVAYAEACLAEGYQTVIAGHFHEPFRQVLAGGELIALGDWISQYSYAVWEDQAFRLESYTPRVG